MKFMLHQLGCIVGEDSRVDYRVSFLFMIGKGDIEGQPYPSVSRGASALDRLAHVSQVDGVSTSVVVEEWV